MTAFHVMAGADHTFKRPAIRKIAIADLVDALKMGLDDFSEKPSHYVFLCLMYPIAGIALAIWSTDQNLLPLLFPLMSGFALLGPLAAIGLYEISRRREKGLDTSWSHAFDVRFSSALPSIIVAGLMLFGLFIVWLVVAQNIYYIYFGDGVPPTLSSFISSVLTTREGMVMMFWGDLIGFIFALVSLATTVITFQLLLDRDVGVVAAIDASIRATLTNPVPVAVWGLIVTALLVIGTIPIFAGLAVVMPVLGHASWHLYRKLVAVEG
ncbi:MULTISPECIES: DUF2189 domain-containing protein [Rhizobium]|uniref:DUF2189 domain-containing protein n=1 Tax=Rhizobium tropici TaxID=398 RepID=A0A6P1C379_RHITR|nr:MULTISPECIES: DUF2189 domain-containing protein [Rhizobium]AGB71336.1 putative membrane protein [Rhizobium tropici CIAT 899]MBB4240304.1 putative membrane protein [Rhizobium tropici]MBB5591574.1 putative membrane protein [Rhizobium tropici]MBB6490342.1 putative membrane protein [Rhizobium tropici]NEV11167.1 DUF2189 domain-containing protein [Rhizobium tropici]